MEDSILSVRNVAVSAGGVSLLEGVDIEIAPGEILAVSGRSGCGKSTLLRCVSGLCDPESGEVLLRGESPESIGWPRYRRRVVLVAQQPVLLDESVEANLARVFSYRSSETDYPRAEAEDLLDRLEVGGRPSTQSARSLSVGQQQRVCLIRALLIRPAVLLLDEPTSSLDEDAAGRVVGVIQEAVASGRCGAVLLATHDREQADRVSDRQLDLNQYAPKAEVRM